jgi:hypothetical protein
LAPAKARKLMALTKTMLAAAILYPIRVMAFPG